MSVAEILEVLKNNDMSIGLADGKLKVLDPHQKLTPELRDQIRDSKADLMRILGKKDSLIASDFTGATIADADFQEIKRMYPGLQDLYVATPLQKGMFYHETFAGRETSYSRQIFFDMTGRVDADMLRQAWQTVIARHDVFRTCFVGFDAAEIHQLVNNASEAGFTIVDLQQCSADEQNIYLSDLRAQERNRKFNYGRPAFMRMHLCKLSAERSHFLCTYHHAILDGWSIPLLLDEVNICYQAIRQGQEPSLPDAVPFGRYIDWLRRQDERVAQDYWTGYLSSYEARKRALFPAIPNRASHFGTVPVEIDSTLSEQLIAYCSKQRSTVNAMLHLAWALTLGRFMNLDDVVVGSASSVRPPDIENVEKMLGLLINTVPVRVKIDAEQSIGDALQALTRHNAESADYRYFALEKLQSVLGFSGKVPLLETMLVFQNYPDYGKADGDELTKNVVLANTGYSEDNNFALTVNSSLVGSQLLIEIAHDERVEPALVDAMAGHLRETLRHIAKSRPETKVIALDGDDHVEPFTAPLEATLAAPARLVDLIDAQAKLNPRKKAVTYDDDSLNYQQLVERSNRLANYMIGTGVRSGDVVAVMLDRSLNLMVSMLAIAKAGASYMLLNASEPMDRIDHKLSQAAPSRILTDEHGNDRLDSNRCQKIVLDGAKTIKEISRSNATTPIPTASTGGSDAAIAYLQHVSTPSGYPEIVAVSHDTLATLVAGHNARALQAVNKKVLCASSVLLERYSLELFAALCEGAEILQVNDVLDLYIDNSLKPTAMCLSADDLGRLLARGFNFEEIQTVTLFDGQYSMTHLERLLDQLGSGTAYAYLSYPGCAIVAGVQRLTREGIGAGLRFEGVSGHATLRVVDRFGRRQPPGALGDLHVCSAGANVATGDVATTHAGGSIEVISKSRQHCEVAGYRANFKEIEFHINDIEMVESCAVMMRDDDKTGELMVAYLVLSNGFIGSSNSYSEDVQYFEEVHRCKKYLLSKLPATLVPEVYIFLERLPLLANGEVDKQSLPSPKEVSNERRNFLPPKNAIEETLVTLWEGGFLLNDISCSDDYFELGGSSLLQVKLSARINKEFGTSLALTELFSEATSIVTQAEVIDAAIAAKK